MITMNELVDLRMQQHIAHEIYRQQIMQRIPDPFPHMLAMGGGLPMPRHMILPPPRVTLPGVEVTLQNDDLWQQFHHIGTEMIITKSGRRMFPSMRLTLGGLEEESNYCVLLEMVPIGDCRFKFSGSQWVPAGGAEPQSPQRMFLHPDSPATGAHWQSQAILFNKVKLTNNTLDSSGHVVLASMHKYQPRIHIIRTADLSQIPWAPQQAFVFPETEFVAVTAYQNDRITKLKIDNNPFAKGFRETGQSRCKRKMSSSLSDDDQDQQQIQFHPQHHQQSQSQQQRRLNILSSPVKCTAISMNAAASTNNTKNLPSYANGSIHVHDIDGDHEHDDDNVVVVIGDGDDGGCGSGSGSGSSSGSVPQIKRLRSNGSASSTLSMVDEVHNVNYNNSSTATKQARVLLPQAQQHSNSTGSGSASGSGSSSDGSGNGGDGGSVGCIARAADDVAATSAFMHHLQQNMQTLLRPSFPFDFACTYFGHAPAMYAMPSAMLQQQQQQQLQSPQQQQHQHHTFATYALQHENSAHFMHVLPNRMAEVATNVATATTATTTTTTRARSQSPVVDGDGQANIAVECNAIDCETLNASPSATIPAPAPLPSTPPTRSPAATIGKRKGFSISAILDGNS